VSGIDQAFVWYDGNRCNDDERCGIYTDAANLRRSAKKPSSGSGSGHRWRTAVARSYLDASQAVIDWGDAPLEKPTCLACSKARREHVPARYASLSLGNGLIYRSYDGSATPPDTPLQVRQLVTFLEVTKGPPTG
jgi:hypothetical protein